jgi:hypothetical protein
MRSLFYDSRIRPVERSLVGMVRVNVPAVTDWLPKVNTATDVARRVARIVEQHRVERARARQGGPGQRSRWRPESDDACSAVLAGAVAFVTVTAALRIVACAGQLAGLE